MAKLKLLVGSRAFLESLTRDLAGGTRRALVQAMTFEGDDAGRAVADGLLACRAPDRKVLVDAYTRFIVSDRFVYSPRGLFDRALQSEVRATRAMFESLEASGAKVRFTNPVGPLFVRFPLRNHKKLVVVDDVAYVGGINFSDHNFAWHDLMVRMEDRAVADHLAGDFQATYDGAPRASEARFDGVTLWSLDGVTNERGFAPLLREIASAKRSLMVVSPYLTFPFCERLREAKERGVRVTILTPRGNNKGIVRDYLMWEAARSGFEVRLYDGMSHLKAMLIDDEKLVVGSSNFDFVSFRSQEELVAMLEDPGLVAAFHEEVLKPDLVASLAHDGSTARGRRSFVALKIAEGATRASRALFGG